MANPIKLLRRSNSEVGTAATGQPKCCRCQPRWEDVEVEACEDHTTTTNESVDDDEDYDSDQPLDLSMPKPPVQASDVGVNKVAAHSTNKVVAKAVAITTSNVYDYWPECVDERPLDCTKGSRTIMFYEQSARSRWPHEDDPLASKVKLNRRPFDEVYHLGGTLGTAGFARVFSAVRYSDNLPVAVKMLNVDQIVKHEWYKGRRIPLEMAFLLKLWRVPGVIKLYEWFEEEEDFIMILERFVPSIDLRTLLANNQRICVELARHIFSQLVFTLLQCVQHGVLHHNIKTENIIFDFRTLSVRLCGFSCGEHFPQNSIAEDSFIGVVFHPPSEWNQGYYNKTQARMVWSLGLVLLKMLFSGTKERGHAQRIRFFNDLPEDCRSMLFRCLEGNPKARIKLHDIMYHHWIEPQD